MSCTSEYSQGHVEVAKQIFENILNLAKSSWQQYEQHSHSETIQEGSRSRVMDPAQAAGRSLFEYCLRMEILNRRDVYGNSLLHLAAWNGKAEMYDWLVQEGADEQAINSVGLTPVRFGIWDMFNHIRKRHLQRVVWRFGNVVLEREDFSQVDWRFTGPFKHIRQVQLCLDKLSLQYVDARKTLLKSKGEPLFGHSDPDGESGSQPRDLEVLRRSIAIADSLGDEALAKDEAKKQINHALNLGLKSAQATYGMGEEHERMVSSCNMKETPSDESDEEDFLSAVTVITLFRPKGWFDAANDCVEQVVLKKWNKAYGLVHLGNSIIPFCIILILFGFM
jgi:hypothetical protein